MSGEERFKEFVENIDRWSKAIGIREVKISDDIEEALNLDGSRLDSLTYAQCHKYAYDLYSYSNHLESMLSAEKVKLQWADESIWYIIANKISQYGGQYAKWQEKYYNCVRENPLASEILKIKNNAQARVETLQAKVDNIKKLSDILLNLARRK
jgi:hypothetical protein